MLISTQDQPSYIFTVIVTLLADRDLKYKNAKVGGNGDHTSNTAVAPMKAYKSVKDYMQLTLMTLNL